MNDLDILEEINSLELRKSALLSEIERFGMKLTEIESLLSAASQKKEDIASLQGMHDELLTVVDDLKVTKQFLISKNAEIYSDNSDLISEKEIHVADIHKLEDSKSDKKVFIEHLEEEIQEKNEIIVGLDANIKDKTTNVKELDEKIVTLKSEMAGCNTLIKSKYEDLTGLDERLTGHKEAIVRAVKTHELLQNDLTLVKNEIDKAKSAHTILSSEHAMKREAQDSEIIARENAISANESAMAEREGNISMKESQLQDKESMLIRYKTSLERASGKTIPIEI